MKLATFSESNEEAFRIGVLAVRDDKEFVIDLCQVSGSLPTTMSKLLRSIDGDFGALSAAVAKAPSGAFLPLTSVVFGPVVSDPEKILCIGLNYRDHATETGHALPDTPNVFAKLRNSVNGSGQPIVIPSYTSQPDYEAELAVVIGRRAKRVSAANAFHYVAGYTVFNDVSARDYQLRTSQWTLGKSFDTFAPMGPWLVTADEVPDPHVLRITLKVNDETLQDSNTENLVFNIPALIEHISAVMTLEPGDVIATGTPAGVGFTRKPPRYLQSGDIVRVEIERLGVLINTVQSSNSSGPVSRFDDRG